MSGRWKSFIYGATDVSSLALVAYGPKADRRREGTAPRKFDDPPIPARKLSRYQHSLTAEHGSVSDTNLASRRSVGARETGPIPAVRNQHSQLHSCDVAHSSNEMSNLHDFDLTAEDGRSSITKSKKSSMDEQFGASLAAQPEAGELLNEYRRMQYSFPFVPLTTEMTVQSLSQEKPMMLLAIMTVSSWRHRSTQMRLEKRFRTELADRTIVNPRKDLELLQGMLVYLAWSHYFFDAKLQNTASILHLSVSMLSDLRLLQSRPAAALGKASQAVTAEPNENQNRRAVLGCYFLCSTPTHLKFSNNMTHWCRRFSEQPELESDKTIELLIESRRLLDSIQEASVASDQWHVALMEDRILKPFQDSKARFIYWDTQPQRKEHRRQNKIFGRLAHLTGGCNVTSSTQQIAHFSARLDAGKAFLDTLASVPTAEFFVISLAEWTHLPRVTMDIAKLSTHDAKHPAAWSVENARDRAQLNLYLDSFCYRMQNLTTCAPPTQPTPDYWLVMKNIMHSASDWYREKTNKNIAASSAETLSLTDLRASDGEVPAIANSEIDNATDILTATSEYLVEQSCLESPAQQLCGEAWTHLDFSNNFWVSGDEIGINFDTNMLSLNI
nr:hypothetical protein CFP56_11677 [Quercus suber]